MSLMGYTAVGVGARDMVLGPEHYDTLTAERPFARISSNLVLASDGRPWIDPHRVIETSGHRIALLSVTGYDPTFFASLPGGDHLVTQPPQEALEEHVEALRDDVDMIVVMAALPLDDARVLARKVPGIDLILGAGNGKVTGGAPLEEGATRIVYAGKQGQDLAEVRVHVRDTGRVDVDMFMHRLDRAYTEDPEVAARVKGVLSEINAYHRRQAEERLAAGRRDDDGSGFVGGETCGACHETALASWGESRHAWAFQTLEEAGADFNPECVGCHVVAHERPGGFMDALTTPERKNVQCEACHGPGAAHMDDPGLPYGKVRLSTCTGCHDPEHSPEFNYYTYYPKIRHGLD